MQRLLRPGTMCPCIGDLLLGKTATAMTPPLPTAPATAMPVWQLYTEMK